MTMSRAARHEKDRKRRPYQMPELIIYGKVTDLALGDGQDGNDTYSSPMIIKLGH